MDQKQDLKKLFDDPRIPDVDLTGKVMKVLHTQPKEKGVLLMKYRVGLMTIVGMMILASAAYAGVNFLSLKNKDGEVVYETKSTIEMIGEYQGDIEHFQAFFELKEEVLKNGESALFYVAANNPNHLTNLGTKMTVFEDISKLHDKITDQSIKIADNINGIYTFHKAEVLFKNVQEVNPPSPEEKVVMANELRKQAEESNSGYAMMPVEMTDQVSLLYVTYQNDEDKVEVLINNLSGKSNPTSYIDEKVEFKQEKVHVKDVEMLLTEYSSSKAMELMWIYESSDKEQKYSYSVRANTDKVSKDTLIKIAESYLKL